MPLVLLECDAPIFRFRQSWKNEVVSRLGIADDADLGLISTGSVVWCA